MPAPHTAHADVQHYLDGVPDYHNHDGCSPTSGGQLIGYWDSQPGYQNMWDGTAPSGPETQSHPIYNMIASPEHVSQTFNGDACTHTGAPNSVSCFMHTDPDSGGSWTWNVGSGMNQYAAWDNPNTAINESHDFVSFNYLAPRAGWDDVWRRSAFQYEDLIREVNAGRPLLLNVSLDVPDENTGHSVTAYGYRIDDAGTPWFAVRDTWQDGISNRWGITAESRDGQEWWRYDLEQTAGSSGDAYFVSSAVPFIPNTDGPINEDTDFGDSYLTALTLDTDPEMIYASLGEGDQDWYRVWLNQGDRLCATTQDYEGLSGAIDTYIELFDGSGRSLTRSNNISSLTNTSNLFWRAEQNDWYYLGLIAGTTPETPQTGDYALTWYTSPAPEPGTILLISLGLAGIAARRRWRSGSPDHE